nr:DUF3488 domain-containing protein [Nocardioides ungokensis]
METANRFAAPVPDGVPGVHPLLIPGGLVCLLVVDALVCTARRVPLAGLPLLTIYSIPVSLVGGGVSWWIFVLTAAGFLTLLFLQESEQVARWGRPLGQDPADADSSGLRVGSAATHTSAGTIGSVATALALCVPLLVPTLDLHLLNGGHGSGGNGDISIRNPITDLRRDLTRPADYPSCGSRPTIRPPTTCASRCSTGSPTTSGAPGTGTSRPPTWPRARCRPSSACRRRCRGRSTTTT